jgi:hypothetical protein
MMLNGLRKRSELFPGKDVVYEGVFEKADAAVSMMDVKRKE